MLITRISNISNLHSLGKDRAFLIENSWDDYGYKTTFKLVAFDSDGVRYDFGSVKIMRKGMNGGFVDLPSDDFSALGPEFCSLGQEQNYYELFAANSGVFTGGLLTALRDCVCDPAIFDEFAKEDAFQTSLMRFLNERTVKETFRDALFGQAILTSFDFKYHYRERAAVHRRCMG